MKGIVNIEFVLSVIVFISTISFVTMVIINNIPFLHHEAVTDYLKSRVYQTSHILLFDEGSPTDWDSDPANVARIGLSNSVPYNMSKDKIDDLDWLCANRPEKIKGLFGGLGIYTDINITRLDTHEELTLNCKTDRYGLRFTVTRFAIVDDNIGNSYPVRMEVTLTAK